MSDSKAASSPEDYDDMQHMPVLAQELMNENVKQRFLRQCVYTNVSNVLIAVNPFQHLEYISGDNVSVSITP